MTTTPVSATAALPGDMPAGVAASAGDPMDTVSLVAVTLAAGVEAVQQVSSDRRTDLIDGSAGTAAFGTTTVASQAQSFTAGSDGAVTWVELFLAKVGAPSDSVEVVVATDAAGTHVLATSATVAASVLATSGFRTRFSFAAPGLVMAGGVYYLVVQRTGAASNTDYYTAGLRAS